MELFRWMGVASSPAVSNNPHGSTLKPINHADYKQFGFENFGNTCYANSVLQALYFCQPFRDLVCDSHDKSNPPIPPSPQPAQSSTAPPHARPPAHKGFRRRNSADDASPINHAAPAATPGPSIPVTPPTLFSALRSLFLHIALNPADRGTVSPASFIAKLKKENELYRSSMHQDAHEFFNFLLNKIVEDLEAAEPGDGSSSSSRSSESRPHTTFVHGLFEGTLTSETRCLTCETVSSRDEAFLDLSIDIAQNSSVTACLRQFSASEMLAHKNKFFCDACGSLQEAEKRMKIKKLPNVLALHLKRFKYQEDVQKYIKLAYRVAFPLELRLFNTVDDADDPDRLYQLFAIVVHIGGGPHHGHYVAIVKAHGAWLIFDDDTVDTVHEADMPRYFGESAGGAGYVLFYQAVDLDLAGGGEASSADSTPAPAPPSPRKPATPVTPVTPATFAVAEPSTPTPSPTAGESGGFFSIGRSLKHSQSVKLGKRGERVASAGYALTAGPASEGHGDARTNGDASVPVPVPLPVPPLPPKDKERDGAGKWFSARRREKKRERVPVPYADGAALNGRGGHEPDPPPARRRSPSPVPRAPPVPLAPPVLPPPPPVPPVLAAAPPSPSPAGSPLPPAEAPRPGGGDAKPKRAVRKMSLSAMPRRIGAFGRKDKEREKAPADA